MAVVPMEKVRLVAMKRDRKKLLNLLQRRGAVEVYDVEAGDEVFYKKDTTTSRALYKKSIETAESAVQVLDKHVPYKAPGPAFLYGRQAVTPEYNDEFYKKDDTVLRKAQMILQAKREINEAEAEILRLQARQHALEPWLALPVSQLYSSTKKTAVFIGQMEGERSLGAILEKLALQAPELDAVHVEIVRATKEMTYFYVIVLKKDAQMAEQALRGIGFIRPANPTHLVPAEKQKQLDRRIEKARAAILAGEKRITGFADDRADMLYLADHMKLRLEKHEVMERMIQTRHVFILEGYIPAPRSAAVRQELMDRFECWVDILPVEETEDVPVLLKNNWFVEPTESVLESYSMPGKGELDPTPVMAIFYYIMFGLMFSDAGYGLIMALVCGICLLRFKNMEPNWNRNIRMFFWCGISTMFWGVVFSSYFGDVVDIVSATFFGHKVSIPPLWFSPMEKPMLLLVFSLGIGIIHLTAGYVMKAATCIKNKDYSGVIYDAVFPVFCWYPLVLILMGSEMFVDIAGFKLTLPPWVNTACLAVCGVSLVGIMFTGGRESKNWGKRILKGIYAVYNALSGWLSDTLSYSRLLALGLATGVIASVMNQMGALVGGGVVGAIIFILVFAVGQSLNFGINVLGAYVHSNRLEYVEFFGKFYEGGGRKFEPFGMHTQNYKIVEEASSE